MKTNDLTKIDIRGVLPYTERQNVALTALRGLLKNAHDDLKKHETVKDINEAFEDILYSIGSIYEVLSDNIKELKEFSTIDGLEKYAHINNVALLALDGTIKREASLNPHTDKEDGILSLELLLYDLDGIDNMLSDNMDILWQIKDKAALAA